MTLNSLYRKALEKLEMYAAGEDIDPDDQALIASKYVGLYGLLSGLRLVSWAIDEPVPDEASIPLTAMLAWVAANEFGEDSDRFAAEGAVGVPIQSLAERQLRRLLAMDYVPTTARTVYF